MTGNWQVTRCVAPSYKENIIVNTRTLLQGQIDIHFAQGHFSKVSTTDWHNYSPSAPKEKMFDVSLKTHQWNKLCSSVFTSELLFFSAAFSPSSSSSSSCVSLLLFLQEPPVLQFPLQLFFSPLARAWRRFRNLTFQARKSAWTLPLRLFTTLQSPSPLVMTRMPLSIHSHLSTFLPTWWGKEHLNISVWSWVLTFLTWNPFPTTLLHFG